MSCVWSVRCPTADLIPPQQACCCAFICQSVFLLSRHDLLWTAIWGEMPLFTTVQLDPQEVEELRQKLQEVQIGTALSQADSNFLQRELEEKEADIGERRGGNCRQAGLEM